MTKQLTIKPQIAFWWTTSIIGCMASGWLIATNTGTRSLVISCFMLLVSVAMCTITYSETPRRARTAIAKVSNSGRSNKLQTGKRVVGIRLDCTACKKSQSMEQTKIPRFTGVVQFIGYLIATPSVIGVIFAVAILISTGMATDEILSTTQNSAQEAGVIFGATVGFGLAVFIGGSSLIGGLVGWLLLTKRKVFKCINCGFILDRG